MKQKHLLSITDLSALEILDILTRARTLKREYKQGKNREGLLQSKSLVMLFEKPSLRTKLSFDMAMNKLGGHTIYFSPQEVGLGIREQTADIARVISRMSHIIVARTFQHKTIEELAAFATVPVINGLSDKEHPCQALADFMTIWEYHKTFKGLKIAFVGDGDNNIAHSLCLGSALLGADFFCASPEIYKMNKHIVTRSKEIGIMTKANIFETYDPMVAVRNADVVYTDTWISMGNEHEKQERLKIFMPFQITPQLLQLAKKDVLFMHDLPAYRGNEVTSEVIDGKQSIVFHQAENRMWIQMGILLFLMNKINYLKETVAYTSNA
jgi:ornithine carbamoyltransferase